MNPDKPVEEYVKDSYIDLGDGFIIDVFEFIHKGNYKIYIQALQDHPMKASKPNMMNAFKQRILARKDCEKPNFDFSTCQYKLPD